MNIDAHDFYYLLCHSTFQDLSFLILKRRAGKEESLTITHSVHVRASPKGQVLYEVLKRKDTLQLRGLEYAWE